MNTRDVFCPDCSAAAGDPCTAPGKHGRIKVSWHHIARMDAAGALRHNVDGPMIPTPREIPHTPRAVPPVAAITERARDIASEFGCTAELAQQGLDRGWLK